MLLIGRPVSVEDNCGVLVRELRRGGHSHKRIGGLVLVRTVVRPGMRSCGGIAMLADELSELARGIGQGTDDNDVVRMLASLVAASHECIGIADLEGNALFVNEACRRLVGLRDLKAVHSTRLFYYF